MNQTAASIYTEFLKKGGLIIGNIAREQIKLLEANNIKQNGPINPAVMIKTRDGADKYNKILISLTNERKKAYSSILSLLRAVEKLLQMPEIHFKGRSKSKIEKNREIIRRVLINGEGATKVTYTTDLEAAIKMLVILIAENRDNQYIDFDFENKILLTDMAYLLRTINLKDNERYSKGVLKALKSIYNETYSNYDMALCESLYSLNDFLNQQDEFIGESITYQPLNFSIMEFEEENEYKYTFDAEKMPSTSLYELKIGDKYRKTSTKPHFTVRTNKPLAKDGVLTTTASVSAIRDAEDIDFLIDLIVKCGIRNNVTQMYSETNNSLENIVKDSLICISTIEALKKATPDLSKRISKALSSKSSHGISTPLNYLAVLMSPM